METSLEDRKIENIPTDKPKKEDSGNLIEIPLPSWLTDFDARKETIRRINHPIYEDMKGKIAQGENDFSEDDLLGYLEYLKTIYEKYYGFDGIYSEVLAEYYHLIPKGYKKKEIIGNKLIACKSEPVLKINAGTSVDSRGYLAEDDDKSFWDLNYKEEKKALEILLEKSSEKTIDYLLNRICSNDYNLLFIYYPQIFEIFQKNIDESSSRIFEKIKSGNIEGIPDIKTGVVLILTDLIGAGEALKKINDLIVENRKGDNQEIAENLERAQVYLVPVKNKKVFAELESFYREFNIKEHDLNKEMTPKEIPLLKQLIPPGSKVLESGCGTGRLLLALKEAGYDISGYDLLPENVDEVLKEDPEADVSVDDWYHTKYPDKSFNAVYSLGRNILHEYSLPGQFQLFREVARVLKKGGKFIFDIPNREIGMYAENIRAYKEAMNRQGVYNLREGAVYDSPNGEHFSSRYAYSKEDIRNLARLAGFKIVNDGPSHKEELPTGQGDENLYYLLEKI